MQTYTQSIGKQTTTHRLGLESGERLNSKGASEAIKVNEKPLAPSICEQNQTRLMVPTNEKTHRMVGSKMNEQINNLLK